MNNWFNEKDSDKKKISFKAQIKIQCNKIKQKKFSQLFSYLSKNHYPCCKRGHVYGQVDSFGRQGDMEEVKIGVGVYPLAERSHNHP